MTSLLAGIDVGTTGMKVSLYNSNGALVDKAYREYSLSLSNGGWVEIDPDMWWRYCCDSLQEIFAKGKVKAEDVAGVGITCTNSLVLLDSDRRVLRPAIMQLDQRAAGEAESLKKNWGEEHVFQKTGNRISSGAFWGPTLQWLRSHEPHVFQKIQYFLVPTSFLALRMTHVYSIDHSRASSTMLYNIHQKKWDADLCSLFSIEKKCLPEIHRSSDIIGYVSALGSQETGLQEGTPVVAGAMDTVGALIGLGMHPNGGALIMGTVGRLCARTKHLDKRFMNAVTEDGSRTFSMTPVNSAGVSYKWLKNLLFQDRENGSHLYLMMDELAEKVQAGAEGLLYIPYLTGERSPIWDAHANGSFIGITLKHQREHFMRAVLEGVGLALAHNHEILKQECHFHPRYLLAGGGGAASQIWMQIISDILGTPLKIPAELETETRGAAMLAGIGLGWWTDSEHAGREWGLKYREVTPRSEAHSFYQSMLPMFKEFYQLTKDFNHRWNQLGNKVPL